MQTNKQTIHKPPGQSTQRVSKFTGGVSCWCVKSRASDAVSVMIVMNGDQRHSRGQQTKTFDVQTRTLTISVQIGTLPARKVIIDEEILAKT